MKLKKYDKIFIPYASLYIDGMGKIYYQYGIQIGVIQKKQSEGIFEILVSEHCPNCKQKVTLSTSPFFIEGKTKTIYIKENSIYFKKLSDAQKTLQYLRDKAREKLEDIENNLNEIKSRI